MIVARKIPGRAISESACLVALLAAGAVASAQELVFSTGVSNFGPAPLVVFPDLRAGIDGQTPIYVVPTLPNVINPHGFALIGPTTAVAGKIPGFQSGRIGVDIIDIATASLVGSFNPGGADDPAYSGYGTLIVNPAGSHLLLAAGASPVGPNSARLWVVPTPLSALSVASDVLTVPGNFGTAQTHAIAFDPVTGRAYVAHSTGITVIDPPYAAASVAFTIPLPDVFDAGGGLGRGIDLSPDRATLLTTNPVAGQPVSVVTIVHAPFSATSVHEDLIVDHAFNLRAVSFTPDGNQALVVDQGVDAPTLRAQVFAISAPYTATSAIEWLQFPPGGQNLGGFEDIAISPDGTKAALGGGCASTGCPLVVVHAPFTAANFTVETMNVPALGYPYNASGRGAGTVHFWPAPISPQPQLSIDRISVTEGNVGAQPATFTLGLSNPSTQTVTVHYATQDLSAQSGSDFTPVAGTLTFAPGQIRRTLAVPVIGDTDAEADEQFRVVLDNPVNASLLSGANGYDGLCVIVDDDSGNPYIATDSPLPDAFVGASYAQTFTAANTTTTLSWGIAYPGLDLPGDFVIDAATGVLGGIPTHAGSYYFYVYLAGLNVTREYHLTVRTDRIFANGFEAAH